MKVVETGDRVRLAAGLLAAPAAHTYQLADLEEPHWQHTRWWAMDDGRLRGIVVLYQGLGIPMVITSLDDACGGVLSHALPELPDRVQASLATSEIERVKPSFEIQRRTRRYRMRLSQPDKLDQIDTSAVVALREPDYEELEHTLLRPVNSAGDQLDGHFLTQAMTGFGPYGAIRSGNRLVASAGVHVVSEAHGVGEIGNVATMPAHRGKGLATACTAWVAKRLLERVVNVSLNVDTGNAAAIKVYERLGFEVISEYHSCYLARLSQGSRFR